MPETIGIWIVTQITAAAAYAGVSLSALQFVALSAYATEIGTTVLAAATYLGSSLLGAGTPKASDGQLTLQQAIPFRRRIYGKAKIGGYYIFWDSRNGNFYSVLALASHELNAISEYWLGDRRIVKNTDGWVTSVDLPSGADTGQFNPGGNNRVRILSSLGGAGKVAYQALKDAYPGIWTDQHIGIGVADLLLIQDGVGSKDFANTYPGGPQTVRVLVEGAKIIDDRASSGLIYSDNAAMVIKDYLTHQDGWRIPSSFFDGALSTTIASANICDELVALKSGGTEKRYRICGWYDFGEEPRQVLTRMLAACGGYLQPTPDGSIAVRVGKWEIPTVTLTDDCILTYDAQHGQGEFETINEVRATFSDPNNDYQDGEVAPYQNTADITARGYVKSTNIDARHCPSYTQVARIQKIAYHEAAPEWIINLVTNAYGLACRGQRFITLNLTELDINATFRITSFKADLLTGQCTIGLASFGAESYSWDAATEEPLPPPVPPSTATTNTIETPTSLSVVVASQSLGNTSGQVISATVNTPVVRTDLTAKLEYQPAGAGSTWYQLSSGTSSWTGTSGFVTPGTYNVRASFLTSTGAQSAFFDVTGVVVTGTAPSAPTNFDVHVSSGGIASVVWKTPNSAVFSASRIWRNTTATFGSATDISGPIYSGANANMSLDDHPGSGTKYYWVTAEDNSIPPSRSAPVGPKSITI